MGDNADPRKSSLGKLWGGDVSGFAGDVGSGFGQVVDKGQELNSFVLNPVGGVSKIYNAATGGGGQKTELDANQPLSAEQTAQQQAAQAAAAQRAKDKQNQDYLASQQTMTSGIADEDAFIQARNAARKAKGNNLFGAFNG